MVNFRRIMCNSIAVILALVLLIGCTGRKKTDISSSNAEKSNNIVTASAPSTEASKGILYQNPEYGFSFALPLAWKGYSTIKEKWEGLATNGDKGEIVIETGTTILIRDPRWTPQNPRQDIPIMVFSLKQWDSLQKGIFHIGAAPIGPSELGRNKNYVFALPARYNYAFPEGFEEVEKILQEKPLKAN